MSAQKIPSFLLITKVSWGECKDFQAEHCPERYNIISPIEPSMCSTWLAGSSTHAAEMSRLAGASRKQPGCRPGSMQRACVFNLFLHIPYHWLIRTVPVFACVGSPLEAQNSPLIHAQTPHSSCPLSCSGQPSPLCVCVGRWKPALTCRLWVLPDNLGEAWDGEDHAAAGHHARQLLAGPPGAGRQLPGSPLLTRRSSQASGLCTALLQHSLL